MTRNILTRLPQLAGCLTRYVWMAALMVVASRTSLAQDHRLDVGASYTYLRTNILPGCNCFSTNGGSAFAQYELSSHISLLGDVTVTHQGDITPLHYDLTQTTFAAGMRYFPIRDRYRIRLFGDLLLGGAHTSGSLSPSNTNFGGSTTFAFQTGGGIQMPLGRRLILLPIQADYLLTTFGNGADNRQNDLRISAGVLFTLRR